MEDSCFYHSVRIEAVIKSLQVSQQKTNAQQKWFGKMRADITQHQLFFCYCAAVVGRDETLLIKKFYLEL